MLSMNTRVYNVELDGDCAALTVLGRSKHSLRTDFSADSFYVVSFSLFQAKVSLFNCKDDFIRGTRGNRS